MERAEERDDVWALRGKASELDGGLDSLRARVAEVGAGGPLDGRELGKALAHFGIDREIEVGRREMDQLGRLLLDRRDDLRMAMTRRIDGDTCSEIEEQVAVDVLDRQPLPADRHDRVRARQAPRCPRLVELDVCLGLGTG